MFAKTTACTGAARRGSRFSRSKEYQRFLSVFSSQATQENVEGNSALLGFGAVASVISATAAAAIWYDRRFEERIDSPIPLSRSLCESDQGSNTARRSFTQQPRNVNIPRLRSMRGRNLNDKYKVEWDQVMGEGAYGSVHPARVAATGTKVALKKISRRYTTSSAFRTETEALLRIFDNGGHPNISGLRDIYEDSTYYYLILDLVTGGEMFDHLITFGAYSEADAARLMHELASALAFLHGVGVIHNDLKPENLLLSTKSRLDGTIKIIDFGCATVQRDEFVENGENTFAMKRKATKSPIKAVSSTGTTAYWSPERFVRGTAADPSVSLWARSN